jgi:hypothetical protein
MPTEANGSHLSREFEVSVRSNPQGYRDADWTRKPLDREHRILILGDSYTFGWGVRQEASFASRLEASGNVTVYNAGIPGDGFQEYADRAALHAPQLKPTIVVVSIFANDFTTLFDSREEGEPAVGSREPIAFRLKTAAEKLHLYRLAYRAVRRSGIASRLADRSYHDELLGEIFQTEFTLYRKSGGPLDRVWPAVVDSLQKIQSMCNELRAEMAILYLPSIYIVDAKVREKLLRLSGVNGASVDIQRVAEQLDAFCREEEVIFLDPSAELREALRRGEAPYFPADMHFTEAGHGLIAEFLADRLPAARDSQDRR